MGGEAGGHVDGKGGEEGDAGGGAGGDIGIRAKRGSSEEVCVPGFHTLLFVYCLLFIVYCLLFIVDC